MYLLLLFITFLTIKSISFAFMSTVGLKAGQSELNEARVTNDQTKERTHHVTFLNLYIDVTRNQDIFARFLGEIPSCLCLLKIRAQRSILQRLP